eukprot:7011492-Karenia_brevis.AAC.1
MSEQQHARGRLLLAATAAAAADYVNRASLLLLLLQGGPLGTIGPRGPGELHGPDVWVMWI